jgi:hypothetical protein
MHEMVERKTIAPSLAQTETYRKPQVMEKMDEGEKVLPPLDMVIIDSAIWKKSRRDGKFYNRVTGERWVHPADLLRAKNPVAETDAERALWKDRLQALSAEMDKREKKRMMKGVRWLAESLGVSRQRASVLLNTGRIVGAKRNPVSRAWDLSRLLMVSVAPGKRGPKMNVCRPEKKTRSLRATR